MTQQIVVKLTKNLSKEVLEAAEKQIATALNSIGAEAEGYAKDETPVDTGRLRNSITYATSTQQGAANASSGEPAKSSDYATRGKPEENELYIGTNVEYAPYVELGNQKHDVGNAHFLRNALSEHAEHYKEILEAALKA